MLHTIHKISCSILVPSVYSIWYTLVHCNMENVLHYYTSLLKNTISRQRFRTRSHVTRRTRIRRGTLVLVVHKNIFLCSEYQQDYITQQSCALPISSKKIADGRFKILLMYLWKPYNNIVATLNSGAPDVPTYPKTMVILSQMGSFNFRL